MTRTVKIEHDGLTLTYDVEPIIPATRTSPPDGGAELMSIVDVDGQEVACWDALPGPVLLRLALQAETEAKQIRDYQTNNQPHGEGPWTVK